MVFSLWIGRHHENPTKRVLNLKITDIIKDNDILKTARYHAIQFLKDDPVVQKPDNLVIHHAYAQLVKYKNIWNYIS